MYSVMDYGRMLADRVRVDAYCRALAASIRPGDVVVDLGAGTGFFTLEACRLGASKVIAIETNDAISLLRPMARRAGYADRIEIIQRPSTEVSLDRRADVVVADLRGVVPLFQGNLATMQDAHARLLAPGGRLIPQRDVLQAGVVDAPDLYGGIVDGWDGHPFDMREARAASVNTYYSDRDRPLRNDALVTTSASWGELVYGAPAPELVEATITLSATRDATAHGIALWFDAILADGIGFSSSTSDRVYSRGFLPFEAPIAVRTGDRFTLELGTRRGMGDHIWAWSTTVHRDGAVVAAYRQSTFLGLVVSNQTLAKDLEGYLPQAGARGRAVAFMLARMDGRRSVETLAREAHEANTGAFASDAEAIAQARKIVREYG